MTGGADVRPRIMETTQKPVISSAANAGNGTPLTRQQRAELFNKASQALSPENLKAVPDPLQPWRHEILMSYKHGYSVRQIAQILATPEIGVKVSQRAIRRVINAKPRA